MCSLTGFPTLVSQGGMDEAPGTCVGDLTGHRGSAVFLHAITHTPHVQAGVNRCLEIYATVHLKVSFMKESDTVTS